MNTVINDNRILRFSIIYFFCLFLLVAVAISGYLGIASHYIVRDKNYIVVKKLQNSFFLGNAKSEKRSKSACAICFRLWSEKASLSFYYYFYFFANFGDFFYALLCLFYQVRSCFLNFYPFYHALNDMKCLRPF